MEGVAQEQYQLPEGPVIMSPDRLLTAIHREVIMRKPEEFKMACLKDIQRLFSPRKPTEKNDMKNFLFLFESAEQFGTE